MNPTLGGPSQGIRNSIPELEKYGTQNEVACQDNPFDDFLSLEKLTIHALGPSSGPWRYSSKLLPWLIENLTRFDVVILHGLWLYHSYAVWKAITHLKKKRLNTKLPKLYIMPHGMLDPWFQKAKGREFKAIRNWIYWKLIENKVISEANALLFTSETELLLARTSFRPYNPKRESNTGYGIKPPYLFSSTMQEAFLEKCPNVAGKPYLLFLSRIHYKKGTDLLVRAYSNLLETDLGNQSEFPRLVIAGPGLETPYGNMIQKLIHENPKLKDLIFFTGMLTGDAKWGAIYSCEAFILPSHQENFGISVVEALACGKPVLISDQVNIWREIKDTNSGLVFRDTVEDTYFSLKSWVSYSQHDKKLIGVQAMQTFLKYFTIKDAALRLIEAIK